MRFSVSVRALMTLAFCGASKLSCVLFLQDLQHAIDLSPDTDAKAECHTERGMTYQKMHDFARAVKDLKQVGFELTTNIISARHPNC